jgi:ketosteroid isomerase-like protein
MSQENVETFKRAIDAYNSRDIEAVVEEVDPEVEWRPAWGEAAVYRGHEGVRKLFRELDDVLDELHLEYSETRDLGDRVVAIGRVRMRGRGSGAETESPLATVVDLKNGKAIRVRTYLNPREALEAAGLSA